MSETRGIYKEVKQLKKFKLLFNAQCGQCQVNQSHLKIKIKKKEDDQIAASRVAEKLGAVQENDKKSISNANRKDSEFMALAMLLPLCPLLQDTQAWMNPSRRRANHRPKIC